MMEMKLLVLPPNTLKMYYMLKWNVNLNAGHEQKRPVPCDLCYSFTDGYGFFPSLSLCVCLSS